MNRGSYLVNASRGGLVNSVDSVAALRSGQLADAALDTVAEEPQLAVELYSDVRVIITPHIAFLSKESLEELRERAARSIVLFHQSHNVEHRVV